MFDEKENARQGGAIGAQARGDGQWIPAQGISEAKATAGDYVNFTVPGEPVGKGRPRAAKRGKHITLYTPERTASYENLVALAAQKAMLCKPLFKGALRMRLHIFTAPPQSWSQKKRAQALRGEILPTTKPDLDNVLKAVADACNNVVFVDDKQIVEVYVAKRYSELPRAVVIVEALN